VLFLAPGAAFTAIMVVTALLGTNLRGVYRTGRVPVPVQ
jgi:hypothetical protein